jgi:hypothetical protein
MPVKRQKTVQRNIRRQTNAEERASVIAEVLETKENEASEFAELKLKDGMDPHEFLVAVKEAGILGLEHFLRSRQKIFLSQHVFIGMTKEAFETESFLFQCRLYRTHDRYDTSFRFYVSSSSSNAANQVSCQERTDACTLAVELVRELEPEKVVFSTALERPFPVPSQTVCQFLTAKCAPRTVVFQQILFTDEQLEAVKYFCGNLEFEDCFGNIEAIYSERPSLKQPNSSCPCRSANKLFSRSFGVCIVSNV